MARAHLTTEYTACPTCDIRIIWPVDAKGTKLPPANYGPDPAGQLAIQHTAAGVWLGRFLAKGEEPKVPEKRFSKHKCQVTAPPPASDSGGRTCRLCCLVTQGGTAGLDAHMTVVHPEED